MRIGKKVIITLFSYIITTVVGFLGTVYFTNTLGAATFGKYVLAITLVKWLLVSDLGVRKATIKRISECQDTNQFYTASLVVHTLQAMIIITAFLLFRNQINGYIGGKLSLLILAMFVLALTFELSGMAIAGANKVHVLKSADALNRIIRIGIQFTLIIFGYNIVGLLLGHIFAFGVISFITLYLLIFRYNVRLALPTRDQFASLYSYAKFSFSERIRSQTFARMDVLMMGLFVTPSIVATYQVAWTISMLLTVLSQSVHENLFPEISKLNEKNQKERIRSLIQEGLAYAGVIPVPGLMGAVILGEDILSIFGSEFVSAMPLLLILVTLSIVSSIGNQLRNGINSLNYPKYAYYINITFIITNATLNIILVYHFGAVGAAFASLMSIIISTIYALILLRSIISVSIPWRALFQQVLAGIMMAGMVWGIKQYFKLRNPIETFALVMFGAVVYLFILMIISTNIRLTVVDIVRSSYSDLLS